jgi:hypothetical protein
MIPHASNVALAVGCCALIFLLLLVLLQTLVKIVCGLLLMVHPLAASCRHRL